MSFIWVYFNTTLTRLFLLHTRYDYLLSRRQGRIWLLQLGASGFSKFCHMPSTLNLWEEINLFIAPNSRERSSEILSNFRSFGVSKVTFPPVALYRGLALDPAYFSIAREEKCSQPFTAWEKTRRWLSHPLLSTLV